MRAILINDDSMVWQETPDEAFDPAVHKSELLIKVHASAVNRADLAQRAGGYPPPPGASVILGLECAGVVAAVGNDVANHQPGDKVCALLSGGGYAEQVRVPAGQVLPMPEPLSFTEAAAIPEVFATAYLNLYMEAGLKPGERALLHAGASGVGTAGIQLCQLTDNPCYVTAGNQAKIDQCVALGALGGADRHSQPFYERVQDWTDGNGFDVILDPVGGAYLQHNLASLAADGRLVVIGLMGGAASDVNLGLLMMKRLRVIGSTLRARSVSAKTEVMQALHKNVWPAIALGKIKPIIETILPIEQANAAHELVAGNQTVGKVILQVV